MGQFFNSRNDRIYEMPLQDTAKHGVYDLTQTTFRLFTGRYCTLRKACYESKLF